MGANRRYADQPISIPTWASTVRAMQAANVLVSASCQRCSYHKPQIDYDALIAAGYGDLCLFDHHPKCPTSQCQGRILFAYTPGPSTPRRPCITRRQ